jgi:hypothetical protein
MKFWKVLRWLATAFFILVLLSVWLSAETGVTPAGSGYPSPRPPPVFE